jgi:hypothetical protein
MGGGPFDAGKGGQGDTYGPTGEPAYLQDTKLVFPRVSNDDLLKIGYTICKAAATGASSNVIESALVKRGVPEGNAGYLVTSAQMWLCPN